MSCADKKGLGITEYARTWASKELHQSVYACMQAEYASKIRTIKQRKCHAAFKCIFTVQIFVLLLLDV